MAAAEHSKALDKAAELAGSDLAYVRPLPPVVEPFVIPRLPPPPPTIPLPPPAGRPTPPSQTQPQPQPQPQQEAPERYDPTWDDPGEFAKPRESDEETRYRRRRKRQRRNCCDPAQFPLWCREHKKVTDKEMGVNLPWEDRDFNHTGFTYQVCMFGRQSYVCSGGGKVSRPDARFADRCWIGDAKHIHNPANSPFMKAPDKFQLKVILKDVIDEYERYGIVTRNPDPPGKACWNIGLLTVVSEKGAINFFKGLYQRFDIEGMVEYRPIREACKQTSGPGSDPGPDGGAAPPRYNPKGDWWNYDPSEYYDPYLA